MIKVSVRKKNVSKKHSKLLFPRDIESRYSGSKGKLVHGQRYASLYGFAML